jgi:prepilin-type N-terminal cleavage/methylation domain-containing protein
MRIEERGTRNEERGPALALRPDGSRSVIRHSSIVIRHSAQPPHGGMTLIELLIVIVIITTLVSAAIPLMAPTNDDRRLREASRAVNSFFAAAQARAISIQRPVGVGIKRLNQVTQKDEDRSASVELYYVEQPSPFVGFNEQSQARVALYSPTNTNLYNGKRNLVIVQFVVPGTTTPQATDRLPVGWDADQFFPNNVVRPLDIIEIGGTRYQLISDTSDATGADAVPPQLDANNFFKSNTGLNGTNVVQIVAQPLNDSGQMLNVRYDNDGNELPHSSNNGPFRYWTEPAPYKILRQPMKTSAEPLQLPESTAIDLRASGLGDSGFFYYPVLPTLPPTKRIDNDQDILIMFAPEGRVSRLALNLFPSSSIPFDQPIVDNIFLLVGKRENCPPPDVGSDKTLSTSTLPPSSDSNREKLLADMKKPVNWLRGESRWIVIGSQSGRVVTVENAFVDPAAAITTYTNSPYLYSQSSEELRTGQIWSAREFVKEMKQLGGR